MLLADSIDLRVYLLRLERVLPFQSANIVDQWHQRSENNSRSKISWVGSFNIAAIRQQESLDFVSCSILESDNLNAGPPIALQQLVLVASRVIVLVFKVVKLSNKICLRFRREILWNMVLNLFERNHLLQRA